MTKRSDSWSISRKLEQGGEVAHSDVIKAQIQANDQQRAVQEAKLAAQNARLNLAVLLFPNFFQDFTLADDLAAAPALPPMSDVAADGAKNNPELGAAFAALEVANHEVAVARAGHLPSLALDYFYGIDANHFAVNGRRLSQPRLRGHGDAEYSGVALGRDREQGEASRVAAAPGEGGIERGAAAGGRRSAIVLCRGGDRARTSSRCCATPPIWPPTACG